MASLRKSLYTSLQGFSEHELADSELSIKTHIQIKNTLRQFLPYIPGLVWWALFAPGISVQDSFYTYEQVETRNFGTDQTIVWPLYVYLVSFGGNAYGFVTLLNVIMLTWSLCRFTNLFFTIKRSQFVVTVLMCLPQFSAAAVHMWHDTTFSIGLILFSILFFKVTSQAFILRKHYLEFALASLLISTRLNGFIVIVLSLVIGLLISRRDRNYPKLAFKLLVAAILLSVALPVVLLQKSPSRPSFSMQILAADINCIASQNPEAITAENWKFLEQIDSKESWSNGDSCVIVNRLFWGETFNRAVIDRNPQKFFRLWLELSKKRPETVVAAHLQRSDSFLMPPLANQPARMFYLNIWDRDNSYLRGNLGIVSDLGVLLMGAVNFFSPILGWSGLWFIFVILSIVYRVYFLRDAREYLWLITLLTVNQLFLIVFAPAPEARYGLAAIWMGSISFLYLMAEILKIVRRVYSRLH
jgi:hypothetical protein